MRYPSVGRGAWGVPCGALFEAPMIHNNRVQWRAAQSTRNHFNVQFSTRCPVWYTQLQWGVLSVPLIAICKSDGVFLLSSIDHTCLSSTPSIPGILRLVGKLRRIMCDENVLV